MVSGRGQAGVPLEFGVLSVEETGHVARFVVKKVLILRS